MKSSFRFSVLCLGSLMLVLSCEARLDETPSGFSFTVHYYTAWSSPSIHYGLTNGTPWTTEVMNSSGDNWWSITLSGSDDRQKPEFCFTNGSQWDSRNGMNYFSTEEEIWIKNGHSSSNGPSKWVDGALLLVNSYGENGNWENIQDGKYWITFEAAIEVELWVTVWGKDAYGEDMAPIPPSELERVDWSETKYFPPIANQGAQDSCAAFATSYYVQSFYQARLNDWDFTGAFWDLLREAPSGPLDQILSPAFTYYQASPGDYGSLESHNALDILRNGVCTWANMPYDQSVSNLAPTSQAYDNALAFRTNSLDHPQNNPFYDNWRGRQGRPDNDNPDLTNAIGRVKINSQSDLEDVIDMLEAGYLFVGGVATRDFPYLGHNDVWTRELIQAGWSVDHAQAIVGFRKNIDVMNESLE